VFLSKTRVLLINPTFDVIRQLGELGKLYVLGRPLGLGYLDAYLESKGIEARIIDGQISDLTEETLGKETQEFSPNIVGITSTTALASAAHEVAKWTKNISKDIKVVMGGVHPTVLPGETLEDDNVDVVVRGEGEITFFELATAFETRTDLRDVLGISFKSNGEIVHNENRPFIKDLDSLPPVDDHILPRNRYSGYSVLTARGCPFNCIFCSSRTLWGTRYRVRSPENVFVEIDFIVDKYNPKEIAFIDESFVTNKARTEKICDMFIERGYHKRMRWICSSRADLVDEPLLAKMREAGCSAISFGIETASRRLLDILRKGTSPEINEKAVRMAKRAGISNVRATFILGIPTETREESLATIKYAKKLPLDSAKFSIATPYPGTELYRIALSEGMAIQKDWSKLHQGVGFSEYDPVWIPKGRDPKELKKLQRRAHLEFYLSPRRLFYISRIWDISWKNVKSWEDIKMYWRIGKSLLARDG